MYWSSLGAAKFASRIFLRQIWLRTNPDPQRWTEYCSLFAVSTFQMARLFSLLLMHLQYCQCEVNSQCNHVGVHLAKLIISEGLVHTS